MFRLDEERCIKCTLCAIECPINIIYIDWHNEKNEAGKSVKVLDRFDVDLKRCMFCQLCEEACPTVPKSIWLTTKTYEMAAYDRNESLYLDIRKLTDWRAAPEREAVHRRGAGVGPMAGGAPDRNRPAGSSSSSPCWRWRRRSRSSSRGTPCTRRSSCCSRSCSSPASSSCSRPSSSGAVQMLVYAGGIMVLFLFVVMLVNPRHRAGTARSSSTSGTSRCCCFPIFLLPFLYILWTEKLPDVAVNPDAFRMVGDRLVGQHRGRGLVALPRLPRCRSRSRRSSCSSR